MKHILRFSWVLAALCVSAWAAPEPKPVHVWERQELTFAAAGSYANPYTDVIVWVELTGPHFQKRVY